MEPLSTILTIHLPAIKLLFISAEQGTVVAFILCVLLFLSFCVSGAEVAFFSLSFKDINLLKTKNIAPYKRIVTLLEQPKKLLTSLLIVNTTSNLGMIIITNYLLDEVLLIPNAIVMFGVKALIMMVFIFLFAEILPKTLAAQQNIRFAKDVSWLIELLYQLCKGPAAALVGFSEALERGLGQKSAATNIEELNRAIDVSEHGATNEKEKDILKGILKFGTITVKQVMRTRLDVTGIPFDMSFDKIKEMIAKLHFSRLPVYEGSLDDIKGIIHTKDLLDYIDEADDFNWHPLIRTTYFVHEQKFIEDLMKEFQEKRIHFAIVADEFGGTSGIITHEDILEEIVGDIKDEYDDEDLGNKKLDDFNYLMAGKTMLNDVCRFMDIDADTFEAIKDDSDSLAGLILEISGVIPDKNAVISTNGFDFTIVELQKNRIEKVKVTIQKKDSN